MNKRFIITILCSVLMLLSVSFGQSDIIVSVNNTNINFPDASPYIENGRTLVPVRFIAESLGAEVEWNQTTQEVTITKDGKQIVLKIGDKLAKVDSESIELDVSAEIKEARTFVPLRFISEAFDAKVEWEATTRTVLISTNVENNTWIKPIDSIIDNKELLDTDTIKDVELVDENKYSLELITLEGQSFIKSNIDTYSVVVIRNGAIDVSLYPMVVDGITYIPVDFDINDYDYLGIYDFSNDHMELIPNTFSE